MKILQSAEVINFCGEVTDEVDAIEYAVANGAKIINASLRGLRIFESQSAMQFLPQIQKGVLFVASAGNDGANNDLTANISCKLQPAQYHSCCCH